MESIDQEFVDAENGAETEQPQRLNIPIKFNMDVNLGINLSIGLILLIFGGFLFLPSKMLLDTSYEVQNENYSSNGSTSFPTDFLNSMSFQKKRLCPGLNYKYWIMTSFFSNYDRNCTYARRHGKKSKKREIVDAVAGQSVYPRERKKTIEPSIYNGTIGDVKSARPKSIPVTGHILAMMLVVSAVAAFVEVLRIRFINPKDSSTVENAGSRKGSTVELMIHGRFLPKAPMRSQRSFELQGMHRSALRLLGARPPPLIRRSSFPTYLVETMDALATTGDTPTARSASRRPSGNAEGLEAGALHRRAHLIRRH